MSETAFLPVPDMSAPALEAGPRAPDVPFEDSTLEASYQFDREMLLTPAPATGKGLVLLGSLALFVLTQLGSSNTAFDIAALIGVLLFHELGHFAGMKLFGYRDVRMFFIPFFGAAVSGRRGAVAGWKEAIVLLLGPLPGLIAGVVLIIYLSVHPHPLWRSLALSLITINAFNLLPISPLDGGQFFRLLLFSRHRYLEVAFAAVAGGVLVAVGLAKGFIILPLIGLTMLLGLPRLARLLKAAKTLRDKHVKLAADPAELEAAQARDLFLAARAVNLNAVRRRPRDGAVAMDQVLERTLSRPPSILASLGLLLPWVVGVMATLVGVLGIANTSTPNWQLQNVPEGGFSIKMPHLAPARRTSRPTALGLTQLMDVDATGTGGSFYARWFDLPPPSQVIGEDSTKAFFDRSRDALIGQFDGKVIEERSLPGAHPGREVKFSSPSYGTERVRFFLVNSRVFILLAPAEPAGEADGFFDSFRLH